MSEQPSKRTIIPNRTKVVEFRRARGWTQEDLMEAAIIDKRTMNRIESGRPVFIRTLQSVAKALEVPLCEIADGGVARADQVTDESLPRTEKVHGHSLATRTVKIDETTVIGKWEGTGVELEFPEGERMVGFTLEIASEAPGTFKVTGVVERVVNHCEESFEFEGEGKIHFQQYFELNYHFKNSEKRLGTFLLQQDITDTKLDGFAVGTSAVLGGKVTVTEVHLKKDEV